MNADARHWGLVPLGCVQARILAYNATDEEIKPSWPSSWFGWRWAETGLTVERLQLVGVYDFQRMNQVIIAYHAVARGEIRLSPELAEYKLFELQDLRCWRAGTGYALADWLRSKGHEPVFVELPPRPRE